MPFYGQIKLEIKGLFDPHLCLIVLLKLPLQ